MHKEIYENYSHKIPSPDHSEYLKVLKRLSKANY